MVFNDIGKYLFNINEKCLLCKKTYVYVELDQKKTGWMQKKKNHQFLRCGQ